jgi:hypothetical protein
MKILNSAIVGLIIGSFSTAAFADSPKGKKDAAKRDYVTCTKKAIDLGYTSGGPASNVFVADCMAGKN